MLGRATVQGDIQGAVIVGIAVPEAACCRVVGRKNTTDERNERDRISAVVAYAVDIPPNVAILRDGLAEVRSSTMLAAASRPDSAAIGTPGPGCVLPPAR